MKKALLITLILGAFAYLHAQQLIAVEHNGNSTFFSNFQAAYNASQANDIIYLPGGNFYFGDFTLSKKLQIIGAGTSIDSTVATGWSSISGTLIIDAAATGTSVVGIKAHNIYLNGGLTNLILKRCVIDTTIFYSSVPAISNVVISECNIGWGMSATSSGGSLTNSLIENSVLQYVIGGSDDYSNTIFDHCVFNSGPNSYQFLGVSNLIIRNSVFVFDHYCFASSNNCIFHNNLIFATPDVHSGSTVNSYSNVVTANSVLQSNSFHLVVGSPGLGAASDGTETGIYGGMNPYKDGAVPFNPHIQIKSISNITDLNGNLPVNIKVAAQSR